LEEGFNLLEDNRLGGRSAEDLIEVEFELLLPIFNKELLSMDGLNALRGLIKGERAV